MIPTQGWGSGYEEKDKCPHCKRAGEKVYWNKSRRRQSTLTGEKQELRERLKVPVCGHCGKEWP